MRIVFIGTVQFSYHLLQILIERQAEIVGVITQKQSSFNTDFCDMSSLCKQFHIPFMYATQINQKDVIDQIHLWKPDIIFCFGFSQLLKQDILNSAPMGVLGYHPTKLPLNRGRHPLIWALVYGMTETGSTFFFMDEGADSGNILSQKTVKIDYEDDAMTLYQKVVQQATEQMIEFLPQLQSRTYHPTPQDHACATYWRKRTKDDGKINFQNTSRTIYNLVRGLTHPYAGAHVCYHGADIKIWKVCEWLHPVPNQPNGYVLDVTDERILVTCRKDHAIALIQHDFQELPRIGEYL